MSLIIRRKPTAFERFFEDAWREVAPETEFTGEYSLALNVRENADGYTVRTALPGLSADDIEIRLHDDVLTISAEIKEDGLSEDETQLISEIRYGKFSRSLRFPVPVEGDKVEASYIDGVLRLIVPKAEAAKPRQIRVKAGHSLN